MARFSEAFASYASTLTAPFQHAVFRRVWIASLLSNFGMLIQGVGAAWAMTLMTDSANMVALVQTASSLPIVLISIPAGAIADMYDRRSSASPRPSHPLGSVALVILFYFGLVTPYPLLAFCFVIASGTALFGPAWQASVGEQVPPEALPSAIALNSINYNIARSFGPAVGGLIVAASGTIASFITNAVLYLPLIFELLRWKRVQEPSRLPPERLGRAIVSGGRYVMHSPAIRTVLIRSIVTCTGGASAQALLPLVARDLLHGGAPMYGILLGAFGFGAVIAGLNVAEVRQRFTAEQALRTLALMMGIAIVVMSAEPVVVR